MQTSACVHCRLHSLRIINNWFHFAMPLGNEFKEYYSPDIFIIIFYFMYLRFGKQKRESNCIKRNEKKNSNSFTFYFAMFSLCLSSLRTFVFFLLFSFCHLVFPFIFFDFVFKTLVVLKCHLALVLVIFHLQFWFICANKGKYSVNENIG